MWGGLAGPGMPGPYTAPSGPGMPGPQQGNR
jgi:hypothetical protein